MFRVPSGKIPIKLEKPKCPSPVDWGFARAGPGEHHNIPSLFRRVAPKDSRIPSDIAEEANFRRGFLYFTEKSDIPKKTLAFSENLCYYI